MNIRYGLCAFLLSTSLACGVLNPTPAPATEAPPLQSEADRVTTCETVTDDYVDISGAYWVEGVKADGSGEKYSGDAEITQISKNCFAIEWHIDGRTRTGILTMSGGTFRGFWYEGETSGMITGVAEPEATSIALSWGPSDGGPVEYIELLLFGVVG
jgi:hypothetical protein